MREFRSIDEGQKSVRRIRTMRPVELATLGLAVAVLAFWFYQYLQWYGSVPCDAMTYLKAGERLNAGHTLYALSPGDRFLPMNPPYWTVPLLSPPLIAVIFRPLAILPNDAGTYIWWTVTLAAVLGTLAALAYRRPTATAWTAIALFPPIVFEMGAANVNSLLLLGAVASWWLFARGKYAWAGAVVAAMAAVKLTPAPLPSPGRWAVRPKPRRSRYSRPSPRARSQPKPTSGSRTFERAVSSAT
jgi:Glycosyltransferase family 87